MVYIIFVISLFENVLYATRINISIALFSLIPYIFLIMTGFLPDTFFMVLVIMLCAAYFAMPTDKKVGSSTYIMFSIVIIIGIVYVILTIVYPASNNSKPSFFSRFQQTIIELFSPLETSEPDTPSDIACGGLNGGALGQYDRIEYTNTLMLTIKTGFKGPVYLKGYIGSVYDNNSWRELTQDEYGEYARLFIDAKADDVYFSTQTSNLLSIIDYDDNLKVYFTANDDNYLANVLRRSYSVKYEESPLTYCYLPYGSLYYMSNTSSYDGYYIDNDKSSLSSLQYLVRDTDYTIYRKMLEEYYGNNEKLLKYIAYEKQYRKFVYDKYTALGNCEIDIISSIQEELPL